MIWGWGDGADGKVIECKHETLSLDDRYACKNPGVMAHSCDPSAREAEMRSLGLAGPPL